MEKVITIPKEFAQKGGLVVIPRLEYEEFLHWKKTIKIYKPTVAEKKALREARRDFARRRYLTLEALRK